MAVPISSSLTGLSLPLPRSWNPCITKLFLSLPPPSIQWQQAHAFRGIVQDEGLKKAKKRMPLIGTLDSAVSFMIELKWQWLIAQGTIIPCPSYYYRYSSLYSSTCSWIFFFKKTFLALEMNLEYALVPTLGFWSVALELIRKVNFRYPCHMQLRNIY
jgi:hypothetical protein